MIQVQVNEAGHIQVVYKWNVFDGARPEDSIHVFEEIERAITEEEHTFLLGKEMCKIVVKKGGFT